MMTKRALKTAAPLNFAVIVTKQIYFERDMKKFI